MLELEVLGPDVVCFVSPEQVDCQIAYCNDLTSCRDFPIYDPSCSHFGDLAEEPLESSGLVREAGNAIDNKDSSRSGGPSPSVNISRRVDQIDSTNIKIRDVNIRVSSNHQKRSSKLGDGDIANAYRNRQSVGGIAGKGEVRMFRNIEVRFRPISLQWCHNNCRS